MKSSEPTELTLYTRVGCHLCEDMGGLLDEFSADLAYTVKRVDIDHDPILREKFNVLVPVIYLGNREVCHHFLDLAALRVALQEFTQISSANRVE